ncbi:MAG: GNAT family N-acetyltransferase [Lachnospiraceae bacterium]|nr:GNAT family N-acetyltransferase [Lachnospiraceae bacterium]
MIRKAFVSDTDAVRAIYDAIHTEEECGRCTVGWIRGVYPTGETVRDALQRDDLYVYEEKGTVLGAGIINQIQVPAYYSAPWQYSAADNEICVLHTLVVAPWAQGKGVGKEFVNFYESYARGHGCPELRMDTNERNQAARRMYRRLGYSEVGLVPTVFNGIPDVNLVLLEKYLSF